MVEIIPKPTKKESPWVDIVFFFSIAVLIGVVIAYFLLGYFIGENEKILKTKQEILNQPRSGEERGLEKKVFGYQKKVEDFTTLINQHKISSDFFAFLEGITHPQVWFSEIKLNVQKAEIELSGEAEKTSLGQQILIFRENEQILTTHLSDVQMIEGERVSFKISLSLNPEIFKFLK